MNEQKQIAQDAIFQIACAMEQIDWLRGVLYVLRDQLDRRNDQQYSKVADLALYNADDWHNQLDCEVKTLEERTEKAFAKSTLAPLIDQLVSSRVPLESFAKGRQRDVARLLGVSPTTISKALGLKRKVFVTTNADGSATAIEECLFPRGHSAGGVQ